MATTMDIIQGISQVMANSYDGARDEEGKKKDTGLKRDEEVGIRDSRVIDGFTVKIHDGNKMCITYTTEVLARDLLSNKGKYQDMLLQNVADIANYIKKEYRKVTGQSLSLAEIKSTKTEMEVIQTSRIRTEVKVIVDYEIGGLEDTNAEKDSQKEKIMKGMEKWLALSSDKRPQNDTRKVEKSDK
jgi:hypothetical protein